MTEQDRPPADRPTTERDILIYTTSWCGSSRTVLAWLDEAGIAYRTVDIDEDADAAQIVMDLNRGYRSVPTIFVDGEHVLTEPSTPELESVFGT